MFWAGKIPVNSVLFDLLKYWRGLGGGERIPARHSMDLRKLPNTVPWMFIVDMTPDGTVMIRLSGSAIQSALGVTMTDHTYRDLFGDTVDDGLGVESYKLAIVRGCGLYRAGAVTLDGQDLQSFETVAVPFYDERTLGGTVMVAAMRPVDAKGRDRTSGAENIRLSLRHMLMIPSPNFIKTEQIPADLQEKITAQKVEPRVMDVDGFLSLAPDGNLPDVDIPSCSLESASQGITEQLN